MTDYHSQQTLTTRSSASASLSFLQHGTSQSLFLSQIVAELTALSFAGNAMGMRTLFPEFSCNGNTCTVVAPPNKFVAPPGWFSLWVLDGPTPSHLNWVRIGGDPGELGNWPDFPDFTLPGMGPPA